MPKPISQNLAFNQWKKRRALKVALRFSNEQIPKGKIKELPGFSIEKPMLKAVKELLHEGTTSSGWHSGFSKEFNGLNPCWAIIFEKKPSNKALLAARMSGLKIHYDLINRKCTDIYLPDVGKNEVKKAEEIFNKFAEEYKNLNKRTSSVILNYINKDAIVIASSSNYDVSKLKVGYKGKYVIHSHEAEKAGDHFDVRLEFPVKSLKKSLSKYINKRPETNEPTEEYPDKPGTVLRSFVNKKMRIPSFDRKLYLIETEDHPIGYSDFKGEISEGYGKGNVSIWDSGDYEILDLDFDKKYTVEFKGNKLKGTYSFIKYKDGFLWVKSIWK